MLFLKSAPLGWSTTTRCSSSNGVMNGLTLELCRACVVVSMRVRLIGVTGMPSALWTWIFGASAIAASDAVDEWADEWASPGTAFVTRHAVPVEDARRCLSVDACGGGASENCGWNILGDLGGGGGDDPWRILPDASSRGY